MKRQFVLLVIVFLFVTNLVHAGPENILTITHFSDTLQKEKTFKVYFPDSAEAGEKFPVLFMLHGAWGGCEDWVARTSVEDLADHYRMIIVFPDGSPFGWYVDSPVENDMQYETYVANELVHLVDKLFPTVARREGRGIMGLSMGGHGAFILSARHPDLFGSASALSGILKITNHPDKWHIAGRLGPMEENPDAWKAYSVWDQAERFKDAGVRILFDCGEDDTKTGAIVDSRQLHQKLSDLAVPHIWREMPGTHSWNYWEDHLEGHLNFHQAAMIEETPGLGRWQKIYFERLKSFFDENARLAVKPPEKTTICLLGSSSFQGFPEELLTGYRVFNRGISADVLGVGSRGLSHRLESSVFDMRPDFLFILNGRNDLGDRHRRGEPSIERMIQEYDEILSDVKDRLPEIKLFIVTCAPVRDKYAHLATSVHSYNMEIKTLAQTHELGVVDLYESLVNEEGLLRPEYSRDGLHITREGDEILAEKMIEALKKSVETEGTKGGLKESD